MLIEDLRGADVGGMTGSYCSLNLFPYFGFFKRENDSCWTRVLHCYSSGKGMNENDSRMYSFWEETKSAFSEKFINILEEQFTQ